MNKLRLKDGFVDLSRINSKIIIDLKYVTTDNFTQRILYSVSKCYLVKSTALKLDRIQKELEGIGLGLKVWDGYRPVSVQKILWSVLPDERFIAHPDKGSMHSRGVAVDLTLVDIEGKELLMPTGYDDFSEKAHSRYSELSLPVLKNRELLKGTMERHGFIPISSEWWHFYDSAWADFPLVDLLPEEMEGF